MIFFIISLLIVAIIVILNFIAPNDYIISKSIVIDKPHFAVFDYLKLIKNQDHWSPWKKRDPYMKQEFYGVDGEVGFIAKWQGNSDVGIGEQEITSISKNDKIETTLTFFKPWKSKSQSVIITEDLGRMETKVTWIFSGKNEFPSNVFMLFYDLDKAVGKDFEEGLKNLKALLEKE
ncbi:MAG: SRPBCC family protein [Flavobacteriaceae bacterium]|nr:SRPBCC family protein [Flavobacteriaceae bacterium]